MDIGQIVSNAAPLIALATAAGTMIAWMHGAFRGGKKDAVDYTVTILNGSVSLINELQEERKDLLAQGATKDTRIHQLEEEVQALRQKLRAS